jgi:hypothetical protein
MKSAYIVIEFALAVIALVVLLVVLFIYWEPIRGVFQKDTIVKPVTQVEPTPLFTPLAQNTFRDSQANTSQKQVYQSSPIPELVGAVPQSGPSETYLLGISIVGVSYVLVRAVGNKA